MRYILIVIFISVQTHLSSQEISRNYIPRQELRQDCRIDQPKQKLKGRRFAKTPPFFLFSDNSNTYAVLHLGKRGEQLFLYINLLNSSTCFKQDKDMDIYFTNGEVISIKNEYPINCEGIFATRIQRRLRKRLMEQNISKVRLFSYQKNYDFFITDIQDLQIKRDLLCLKVYLYR